ncbi:hypothetical protein USB125703_00017 [Pseudoclavibacter triregionum]|nr:hypothetical protein USB125703_00017 [Pseudoclavibacter triregionum]
MSEHTITQPQTDPAKIIDAHGVPGRVPWKAVAAYLLIAFAGAWLATISLWTSGMDLSTADPGSFATQTLMMMYTPTIAALVAVFAIQRPDRPLRMLGLVIRPVGRTIAYLLLAAVAPTVLAIAGSWIAGLLGAFPMDAARQGFLLEQWQLLAPGMELDAPTATWMTLFQTLTIAIPMSTLAAFGEELGWRGFLLSALRPLGRWPMLAISTVVWGLWHAPLILLGYNFADRTPMGLVYMVLFCLTVGLTISWLRIRSESVFPSAVAHGAVNATATLGILLLAAGGTTLDSMTLFSIWPVWALHLLVFGILFATSLGRSPKAQEHRLGGPTHHAPDDLDEDARSMAHVREAGHDPVATAEELPRGAEAGS